MHKTELLIGVAAAVVFIAGAGYLTYSGRPIMQVAPPAEGGAMGSYSLADVAGHGSRESCWSAIAGDVYDLTGWVSRHPGGAETILGLCGTDGTSAYAGQHGTERRPKAALVLLKIGSLK